MIKSLAAAAGFSATTQQRTPGNKFSFERKKKYSFSISRDPTKLPKVPPPLKKRSY